MHEQQTCPRCGQWFECKPGNISACQCYGIRLSAEARQLMAERYASCLCRSCLLALQDPRQLFLEQYRNGQ